MSIDTETISRRAVLGGVAGLGFAFGAGRLFTGSAVAYTQQAAAGGSGGLLVYWRETVNGGVTESSLPSTGDGSQPTGPVVDLTNAQPGDRGALAVGLALGEDVESSARVWMALVPRGPTPYAENGINEPERKAGDVTPDVGELQEYVHVDVWYDDGFFGLGGCDGEYNSLAETAVASGTFAEVADALADGVPVEPSGSQVACFTPNDRRCLGFRWSLDESVGNVVQGDSVAFDLAFYAEDCAVDRATSPFAGVT